MQPNIKTTDIFQKIIPLSAEERQSMTDIWEKASDAKKDELGEVFWDAFYEYKKEITNLFYEMLTAEVAQKKEPLDTALYAKAEERFWQHIYNQLEGKAQDQEMMEKLRQSLHSVNS